MSDLIKRKDALIAIGCEIVGVTIENRQLLDLCEFAIKQIPSAKQEVIHCKDCKYATLTCDGYCKYCEIWFPDEAVYTDGDYYCASAELREKGDR